MKQWWLERNPRGRLILSAGAAAFAVIIVVGFIWQPLQRGATELRDAIQSAGRSGQTPASCCSSRT